MAEEKQPLTLEDIKKNTNLMGTIARYASDRYGKNYFDPDEAVEDFLSEYRGIQNNTMNALTFANYASEIKDENYKAQLGQLYNTFDYELENFSDVEDIGSGLAAAGEILAYNIFDPINLIGYGAGKAIASTAGRGAIKGLMGQVFKTASKRPVLAGALTGAAVEGPIGVATEASIQKAEKDLDVREGYSPEELALAGGISGLMGGAFGALGGKLGKMSSDETTRMLQESEQATVQGRLSAMDNLEQALMTPPTVRGAAAPIDPKKELAGTYIVSEKMPDAVKDGYDKLGRVLAIDETKKTATVQFIPKATKVERKAQYRKDMFDRGAVTLEVPLSELKAPTQTVTKRMITKYINQYGTFLDPVKIEEGRKFLKQTDPNISVEKLDLTLPPEKILEINTLTMDYASNNMARNPLISFDSFDPRLKVTERIAQIVDVMPENELGNFKKFLDDNGIQSEDLGKLYRADVSQLGKALQEQSKMASKQLIEVGKAVDTANPTARQQLEELLKKLNKIEETDGKAPSFSNTFVDIWRALLVSQPVTTVRNVFGTAARLPEEVMRAKLDNLLVNLERQSLGLDPINAEDVLKRSSLDVLKNFSSPDEVVRMTRYIANVFEEVDLKIFRVFDDLIPAEFEAVPSLRYLGRAATAVNVLNRAQDRWFKSAAFMTELNNQYIQMVNRGLIEAPTVTLPTRTATTPSRNQQILQNMRGTATATTPSRNQQILQNMRGTATTPSRNQQILQKMQGATTTPSPAATATTPSPVPTVTLPNGATKKISNIRDVFYYQRFDLLNDEMVSKAVEFAFDMAYQNRRTLDKLPFGGRQLQGVLDGWNRMAEGIPALKTIVPFANFMANSFTYTINRVGFGGAIKSGMSRLKLHSLLKAGVSDIDAQRAALREFNRYKEGLVETAGSFSLYGGAWLLHNYYGGDTWHTIKVQDQEYDLRALFPLSGYMLLVDTITREANGEPQRDSLVKDAGEILLGLSTRRGAAAPALQEFLEALSSEETGIEDAAKSFFETVGTTVGSFGGGFLTPFRPVGEALQTFGASERDFRYRRLQKDVIPEWALPDDPDLRASIQGFADGLVREGVKGSPLENLVFGDVPEAAAPTGGDLTTGRGAVFRQLFGATPRGDSDIILNELEKAGINPYRLNMYSEVPEYDLVRNRMLGEVSNRLGMALIRSASYRNADPAKKRRILEVAYFSSNSLEIPNQLRQFYNQIGAKNVNNFIDIANKLVEQEYPILAEVKKLKTGLRKDTDARVLNLLRNPTPGVVTAARNALSDQMIDTTPMSDDQVMSLIIPRLTYKDEKDAANQDHTRRLAASADLYRKLASSLDLDIRAEQDPLMRFGFQGILREGVQ
jgi:hypothetical protein